MGHNSSSFLHIGHMFIFISLLSPFKPKALTFSHIIPFQLILRDRTFLKGWWSLTRRRNSLPLCNLDDHHRKEKVRFWILSQASSIYFTFQKVLINVVVSCCPLFHASVLQAATSWAFTLHSNYLWVHVKQTAVVTVTVYTARLCKRLSAIKGRSRVLFLQKQK